MLGDSPYKAGQRCIFLTPMQVVEADVVDVYQFEVVITNVKIREPGPVRPDSPEDIIVIGRSAINFAWAVNDGKE